MDPPNKPSAVTPDLNGVINGAHIESVALTSLPPTLTPHFLSPQVTHFMATSTSPDHHSVTIQQDPDDNTHPNPPPGPDPDTNYSHPNTPLGPTRFVNRVRKWVLPGAKPMPLLISIAAGIIIQFGVPKPAALSNRAWQLLAIFITTIVGLIVGPLPVGAWAFVCLTATVVTKTLSFQEAFSALTNDVIWLIVVAFFFSRGFVKSGLGDRVATYFIKWLGKKTVGLAYGLVLSEAVVAPAIPSSTARAGGVFSPVIASVAASSGSLPNDSSAKKLGSFLAMTQLQVSTYSVDSGL